MKSQSYLNYCYNSYSWIIEFCKKGNPVTLIENQDVNNIEIVDFKDLKQINKCKNPRNSRCIRVGN